MTIPTYGYAKDGASHLFDLAEGEGLPDGWFCSPQAALEGSAPAPETIPSTLAPDAPPVPAPVAEPAAPRRGRRARRG